MLETICTASWSWLLQDTGWLQPESPGRKSAGTNIRRPGLPQLLLWELGDPSKTAMKFLIPAAGPGGLANTASPTSREQMRRKVAPELALVASLQGSHLHCLLGISILGVHLPCVLCQVHTWISCFAQPLWTHDSLWIHYKALCIAP